MRRARLFEGSAARTSSAYCLRFLELNDGTVVAHVPCMIRINVTRQNGSADLNVEGQLTAATADQLRAACSIAFDQGLDVSLTLGGVSYSDRVGAEVVCEAIACGATVTGCTGLL